MSDGFQNANQPSNGTESTDSPESADSLVEHFFRHEHANLVSVLSRVFGLARLELIEETVQAAMLQAMNSWKQNGLPKNPAAWIHRVAKNRILDELRREEVFRRAMAEVVVPSESPEQLVDHWLEEAELPDSLLRMIFVCCHPVLDRQSQIALTLKVLCGFGVHEIARGLLLNPENVKKRIQRAKQKLARESIAIELPAASELQERLSAVHDTLYLMFNEGYSTSRGSDPIRDDLCEESARLCHLLCNSELGSRTSFALLALMLYHGSRLESRKDEDGETVLLEDQDRAKWDRNLILIADRWMQRAGLPESRFHLEAAIAMLHCRAQSVEATDWNAIVSLYDRLLELHASPVYRLNRAIALAQRGDEAEAMRELSWLDQSNQIRESFLLDCAIAKVHELAGEKTAAVDRLLLALSRDVADHERELIKRKIAAL
ncbi:RNA polymerase sigma factor [Mariniblastus fucicola]|uniref:RNA polymerase sigma factor n=1 Tax=Mariniblastus fucicola TaxID=980251 RepID=A0A5B9PHN9_9BACT|nr:sigma-70 family RNA polymerase sigma factor [Mariniblastus fucicola]QEG24166.1 RNA polymerase sigma factor [Mariniblastus fucicola]